MNQVSVDTGSTQHLGGRSTRSATKVVTKEQISELEKKVKDAQVRLDSLEQGERPKKAKLTQARNAVKAASAALTKALGINQQRLEGEIPVNDLAGRAIKRETIAATTDLGRGGRLGGRSSSPLTVLSSDEEEAGGENSPRPWPTKRTQVKGQKDIGSDREVTIEPPAKQGPEMGEKSVANKDTLSQRPQGVQEKSVAQEKDVPISTPAQKPKDIEGRNSATEQGVGNDALDQQSQDMPEKSVVHEEDVHMDPPAQQPKDIGGKNTMPEEEDVNMDPLEPQSQEMPEKSVVHEEDVHMDPPAQQPKDIGGKNTMPEEEDANMDPLEPQSQDMPEKSVVHEEDVHMDPPAQQSREGTGVAYEKDALMGTLDQPTQKRQDMQEKSVAHEPDVLMRPPLSEPLQVTKDLPECDRKFLPDEELYVFSVDGENPDDPDCLSADVTSICLSSDAELLQLLRPKAVSVYHWQKKQRTIEEKRNELLEVINAGLHDTAATEEHIKALWRASRDRDIVNERLSEARRGLDFGRYEYERSALEREQQEHDSFQEEINREQSALFTAHARGNASFDVFNSMTSAINEKTKRIDDLKQLIDQRKAYLADHQALLKDIEAIKSDDAPLPTGRAGSKSKKRKIDQAQKESTPSAQGSVQGRAKGKKPARSSTTPAAAARKRGGARSTTTPPITPAVEGASNSTPPTVPAVPISKTSTRRPLFQTSRNQKKKRKAVPRAKWENMTKSAKEALEDQARAQIADYLESRDEDDLSFEIRNRIRKVQEFCPEACTMDYQLSCLILKRRGGYTSCLFHEKNRSETRQRPDTLDVFRGQGHRSIEKLDKRREKNAKKKARQAQKDDDDEDDDEDDDDDYDDDDIEVDKQPLAPPAPAHLHCGCSRAAALMELFLFKTAKASSTNSDIASRTPEFRMKKMPVPEHRAFWIQSMKSITGLSIHQLYSGIDEQYDSPLYRIVQNMRILYHVIAQQRKEGVDVLIEIAKWPDERTKEYCMRFFDFADSGDEAPAAAAGGDDGQDI